MAQEAWKDIPGYEGKYWASNLGRIKNKDKVMKQNKHFEGYFIITLYKEGKRHTHKVHRLVALSFIENPCKKPDINHINGKRNDNRVENLEWVTNLENQRHSWSKLGRKQERTIPVLCVEKNKVFGSIKEAGEELDLSCSAQTHITDCIKGRRKTSGGYHWVSV